MNEISFLRTQIETFLQKPETDRTSAMRAEILKSLGVRHPDKFIHSVWSTQWESGIDRLLDPHSLYFRPLDRADFHFKWAQGSFNTLHPEVKSKLFLVKMESNNVLEAVKALFAKIDCTVDALEIKNVEILDKIHSEVAVTVLINGKLEYTFEISHFNLASEEIFSKVAELTQIRTESIHIYTTPQNVKVAFETRLGQDNLISERWDARFFMKYRQPILKEIAAQDAVGDALGTIGRDVHYNLTEHGQVYSFHHRELFHPLSDMSIGFFEPIYIFLGQKVKPDESEGNYNFSEELYAAYRSAYLDRNEQLRNLWPELRGELFEVADLIEEYFSEEVNVRKVIAEVGNRIFINAEDWLDQIHSIFTEV